ncbi:MAG TPA: hypothetical protein VN717_08285 [Gemmatimonadaceae bacterium]|nr:hypothetical protein [Gemmatimonadaceae bacterium]
MRARASCRFAEKSSVLDGLSGSAFGLTGVPQVAQKVSSSGRIAEPQVTQAAAAASFASVRRPQCAQNGTPVSMLLPHHPQLTVSPPDAGMCGVMSSAWAALDARRPMLGDGRWMCGGLALTGGA